MPNASEEPRGPTDDELGRHVRDVWVKWASEQPNPPTNWLAPWEELPDHIKDVDLRIGRKLFDLGLAAAANVGYMTEENIEARLKALKGYEF